MSNRCQSHSLYVTECTPFLICVSLNYDFYPQRILLFFLHDVVEAPEFNQVLNQYPRELLQLARVVVGLFRSFLLRDVLNLGFRTIALEISLFFCASGLVQVGNERSMLGGLLAIVHLATLDYILPVIRLQGRVLLPSFFDLGGEVIDLTGAAPGYFIDRNAGVSVTSFF